MWILLLVCWLCLYHDDDDESGDYGKAPRLVGGGAEKHKVRDKKSREIKKENISGISTFFKTPLWHRAKAVCENDEEKLFVILDTEGKVQPDTEADGGEPLAGRLPVCFTYLTILNIL